MGKNHFHIGFDSLMADFERIFLFICLVFSPDIKSFCFFFSSTFDLSLIALRWVSYLNIENTFALRFGLTVIFWFGLESIPLISVTFYICFHNTFTTQEPLLIFFEYFWIFFLFLSNFSLTLPPNYNHYSFLFI